MSSSTSKGKGKDDDTGVDPVVSYELFLVEPRWLFLRMVTKSGLVGWGEPNVEGLSRSVKACVEELMETVVIGKDSQQINFIWQSLYRQIFYGGACGGIIFMSALAGIDQALWDIHGKRLHVNVAMLLGGPVRHKLQMYRWCGGDNNTPEEAAAEAKHIIETTNFTCLKMNATTKLPYVDTNNANNANANYSNNNNNQMGGIQYAVDRMAAVRKAVGPYIGIGLDFHGRVKLPTVKKLIKALEPYNPMFFEEPLGGKGQNDSLKDLSNMTHIPLATGERMSSIEDFRDLLQQRSISIIQPDVSHCGGITNLLSIVRMADAYEVAIAPHCPLGPIALASCLVVDAISINFAFQESSIGIHYNSELTTTTSTTTSESEKEENGAIDTTTTIQRDLLTYVQNKNDFELDETGCMKILTRPGLGVVIDEDMVRKAARIGHHWKDRSWQLDDGSPTTW